MEDKYKELNDLREKIIAELKPLFPSSTTIEFMKLVEMRVQSALMYENFNHITG